MKLRTKSTLFLILSCALLFQGLAAAWQSPLLPSWRKANSASKAKIPQFILDTRHPWLTAHAGELANLDDPHAVFCTTLKDLIASSNHDPECGHDWHLTGLDIPRDLFHSLEIDNNRVGVDRYGWPNARNRFLEMKNCPRALEEVRELKVDVYSHKAESVLPPDDLPGLFAEVMGEMKGLKKLDWTIRGWEENQAFRDEFHRQGVELRSVEELRANMYASWIREATPRLRMLEATSDSSHFSEPEDWGEFPLVWLESLDKLRELKSLNLGDIRWDKQVEMTELIPKVLPNLEELWVGPLTHGHLAPPGEALRNMTKTFASLHKLKKLHLPYSANLHLDFDGGPWCGNAYDGDGGARLWRQVRLDDIDATERAGSIVQEEIPNLKGVGVGDFYGNFTFDAQGTRTIDWPWTGRLEEWLSETN
ncbi:hypothetical protein CGCS363_v008439 [Colletotrichum siamense]|uniref:uncharacterized protein n=1 Tax=Colletotrichum siamense TaxID=690259 RepID=UPI0018728BEA|nr:uncharacterized protein CGCS363_v008439 [Colletotrichum siamense]KAF5498006.1 hypothetical protein CGCS363_v008439 [Colletotrichum siamense]